MQPISDEIAGAQRRRMRRVVEGCGAYAVLLVITTLAWWMGKDRVPPFLEGAQIIHYAVFAYALHAVFFVLIKTNLNLRLRDPRMILPLILLPSLGSYYVMYHVTEPLLRMPFLFMASAGLALDSLNNKVRTTLIVAVTWTAWYVGIIVLLWMYAPERVNVPAEVTVAFAVGLVLTQVVFFSGFVGRLRKKLAETNRDLHKAMLSLQELATHDPLTRLPNRRAAMEYLEAERSRVERYKPGMEELRMCVALVDVDHFKYINDHYGHMVGDLALQIIGKALARAVRRSDYVARFGGEEFLAIFPGTAPESVMVVAERMRRAVEEARVAGIPGDHRLSASFGVGVYRPGDTIGMVLSRADAALYRAKDAGRNRVIVD